MVRKLGERFDEKVLWSVELEGCIADTPNPGSRADENRKQRGLRRSLPSPLAGSALGKNAELHAFARAVSGLEAVADDSAPKPGDEPGRAGGKVGSPCARVRRLGAMLGHSVEERKGVMRKKKVPKKLSLSRETLQRLSNHPLGNNQLEAAVGGTVMCTGGFSVCFTYCHSDTCECESFEWPSYCLMC